MVPWPAVAAFVSTGISLYFLRRVWPYRNQPGGWSFMGTILCLALWSGAYGTGLLVFDPWVRRLFEIPIWLGINFVGVFFLAFALQYTGRGYRLDSWWMGAIVLFQSVQTVIVITNRFHHIAWTDYAITPVFGAATVSYTHQPWLFVVTIGNIGLIATGVYLLLDTVISYGPLYRKQAIAVGLSPVPPGIAYLAWLFELGPVPALNFTSLVFPLHLALDSYALFSAGMFEFSPAARRMGERAAIDDLGSPVAIVDDDRRVITLNGAAERVFGVERTGALGRPLTEVVAGDGVGSLTDGDTVSLARSGHRREYAVSTSPITDPSGGAVGETVLFQDITEERQREQRLEVLNRVLRHNIRNDLNVVQAYLEVASDRVDDDDLRGMLETAEEQTWEVIDLGEKSREFERALGADGEPGPVTLAPVLARLKREIEASYHPGAVQIELPDGTAVLADERLLELVFRNLIENGIEHNDGNNPSVTVRLRDGAPDESSVVIDVIDNGPGLPEHERAAIEAGGEDDLTHGSGLGLWLIEWGVTAMGGDVSFSTSEGEGTTARVRLPAPDVPPA